MTVVTSPADRNRDFHGGVPFTQFLMPTGRKQYIWVDAFPEDVVAKAKEIVAAGYVFEAEMLSTGMISFTISGDHADYDIRICRNGPEVTEALHSLIRDFVIGETGHKQEIL